MWDRCPLDPLNEMSLKFLIKDIRVGGLYVNDVNELLICLAHEPKQIKWLILPQGFTWWDYYFDNDNTFMLKELSRGDE